MQLRIPYTFQIEAIPQRCKKPRTISVAAAQDMRATISEIGIDQAPLAFRVNLPSFGLPQTLDIRSFNMRLWKPAIVNPKPHLPVTEAEVVVCIMQHHDIRKASEVRPGERIIARSLNDDRVRIATPNWNESARYTPSDYRQVLSTTMEAVENRITDWLDTHLIIDGVLYTETGEPRYLVINRPYNNDLHRGNTSLYVTSFYSDFLGCDTWAYFRADELDEAIAAATALAERFQDDDHLPIVPSSTIDVLMPEHIRCQPPVAEKSAT
jgi:hypothetical protein